MVDDVLEDLQLPQHRCHGASGTRYGPQSPDRGHRVRCSPGTQTVVLEILDLGGSRHAGILLYINRAGTQDYDRT